MENIKAICLECKQETNHSVVQEHVQEYANEEFYFQYTYQIIQCLGCEAVSFRKESFDRDAYDPETRSHIVDIELFPKRNKHYREPKKYWHAPDKVRNMYTEALHAFNNDLPVLCAAGLRAIIEGICKTEALHFEESGNEEGKKKAEIRGLDKKIEKLCSEGHLTKIHAGVLHELRFMGNNAIHQLDPPETEELNLAIEIIEHTLDNLYEIGVKARSLKRKRRSRELDKE